VARAAQAAGHTVAIAGAGGRGSEIAAAGFTAFATSEPRRRPEAADRRTVEAPDPEADVRQLAEGASPGAGARRHAVAVLELARAWKPDVLVRDEVDFGTAIAAPSVSALTPQSSGRCPTTSGLNSRTTRGGASNSVPPGSWTRSLSPRRKCA
jgi:hypothetical protein